MSNTSARALVLAGLPRMIEVSGQAVVWVRPPTVEEALGVYALLPGFAGGSETDRMTLRVLLAGWLGGSLAARVCSPHTPQDTALMLLSKLLGAEEEEGEALVELRWDVLILDVADATGCSAEAVLKMPWPRFLVWVKASEAGHARKVLNRLPLAILPHMGEGSAQMLEDLQKAGAMNLGGKPKEGAKVAVSDYVPDLEVQAGRALMRATAGPLAGREAAMQEYLALTKQINAH